MAEIDTSASAARIAAGRCPGWTSRYLNGRQGEFYRIDITPVNACPNRLKPGNDLCGIHDRQRDRYRGRLASEEAARVARREAGREESYAMNLSMMLTEECRRIGIDTAFYSEHGHVTLDRAAASQLLDALRKQARRD